MRKLFIFLFYNCIYFSLLSQTIEKLPEKSHYNALFPGHYLEIGSGFSYLKVRDEATSPLLYSGIALPNLRLGVNFHSSRTIINFSNDFVYGSLNNSINSNWFQQPSNSFYFTSHLEFLIRMRKKKDDRLKWYLGPVSDNMIYIRVNSKFENSALNYDVLSGLGVGNRLEFPIYFEPKDHKLFGLFNMHRKERLMSINWQLNMPLLNLLFRPAYGSILFPFFDNPDSYNIVDDDNINAGFLRPIYLRSILELDYYLYNQNMLKLSYVWDFYSFNPGFNKVQSAYHGLMFTFVFRFNKND